MYAWGRGSCRSCPWPTVIHLTPFLGWPVLHISIRNFRQLSKIWMFYHFPIILFATGGTMPPRPFREPRPAQQSGLIKSRKRCNFTKSLCIIKSCVGRRRRLSVSRADKVDIKGIIRSCCTKGQDGKCSLSSLSVISSKKTSFL